MKLPRDESGQSLIARLAKLGYIVTRQTGSHVRLTRDQGGEHHITIPLHKEIKIGTLNSILSDVAQHMKMSKDDLIKTLW